MSSTMTRGRIRTVVIALAVLGAGAGVWLVARSASGGQEASSTKARSSPAHGGAPVVDDYERGRELLAAGETAKAEQAFRRAVEHAPSSAVAHYGLGCALLELGDAVGAAAEIESALSLASTDVPWRQDAEAALVAAHLRKSKSAAR